MAGHRVYTGSIEPLTFISSSKIQLLYFQRTFKDLIRNAATDSGVVAKSQNRSLVCALAVR